MKIRSTKNRSGPDGQSWGIGDVVDVPEGQARELVASRSAVFVDKADAATGTETADVESKEKATRKRKPRAKPDTEEEGDEAQPSKE